MLPYIVHQYKGVKILYYSEKESMTLPGWYVKGFFYCSTLRRAKEFIDHYDEHIDSFCRAAKNVLKGK